MIVALPGLFSLFLFFFFFFFFFFACNGRNAFFSLSKHIEIILNGHVRKCVKLSPFYLTIFI